MKNTFTKSENFKSEYSCAVVRIDELTPIEGKCANFLLKEAIAYDSDNYEDIEVTEGSY